MLSKNNRIHSRGGFTFIYSHGYRSRGVFGMLSAVLPREGGNGVFRFGFSIPKKVGGAVQRNTTKRRLSVFAREWMSDPANLNKKSFNSVYNAYKFAESPEEVAALRKEFFGMCDNVSRALDKVSVK